jgi:hypothetical protein
MIQWINISKWLVHDATKSCTGKAYTDESQKSYAKLIQSIRQTNGFNVTEYAKFINMVSGSTLQLNLNKLHLSGFGVVSKKNIHIPVWGQIFFHFSNKTSYYNRLNAKATI